MVSTFNRLPQTFGACYYGVMSARVLGLTGVPDRTVCKEGGD